MLMRSIMIDANEAERIGLVTYVAAPGQSVARAREIAADIVTKPPLAVKWAKAAVNQQVALMFTLNMRLGIATEGLSYLSQDLRENVQAEVDQRPPEYRGV
jgi:enoyl-CoA hydratase/carnithine racemase